MNDHICIIEINGIRVVEINKIEFNSKRKIDWNGVEKYLKRYVGMSFITDGTGQLIHIASDFPDEYTHSKYRKVIWNYW
ncbi:MAG: hypothetical protein K6B44_03815 [Lachnospiraceae bacterium]|nr:hypothetical protein [Lachnospiraceae bacterium]